MLAPRNFTERFLLCYMQLSRKEQTSMSFEELTRRIAKTLGRPISGTTVTRWRDGSEPDAEHAIAVAKVFTVDPGWLMFGEHSKAPAPEWATGAVPATSGKKGPTR